MNKNRRKGLEEISVEIEALRLRVEMLRDEEQDYFDNMPEGLQGGDKGSDAEQAIDSMGSALDSLEEAIGYVDEAAV